MKRIISILLSFALLGSLAACKPAAAGLQADGPTADGLPADVQPASAPAAEPTPEGEKAASVREDVFAEADEWEAQFLSLVEARKQAIMDHGDMLPCSGTAYYLSLSGADSNDGKTPETAWASLQRINQASLQKGDVVYLERGGLWRGLIALPDGVSLSAYGSGAKPQICGSTENGGGAEKWALFSEDEGGKRIWVYHRTMTECGGIVLGDPETIAQKVYAWYDGGAFYFTEDRTVPFNIAEALCRDFTFYCDWRPEQTELPIHSGPPIRDEFTLYLRCDKGNPGELYSSIEFINQPASDEQDAIISAKEGCVLDNLCIRYFSSGIELVGGSVTIQNCEIGFGGGFPIEYFMPEQENGACVFVQGEGVFFAGSNVVIQNSYIHDIDGYGINFEVCRSYDETAPLLPFANNEISGNLITRCSVPVQVAMNLQEARNADVFGRMSIRNNYLTDAGRGWYAERLSNVKPEIDAKEYYVCLLFGGFGDNGGGNISVSDNVFYCGRTYLVRTNADNDFPVFENNVFAQRAGGNVLWKLDSEAEATTSEQTQADVQAQYGNTNEAVVLRPQQ